MPCRHCVETLERAAEYVREIAIFRVDLWPRPAAEQLAEDLVELAARTRATLEEEVTHGNG